LSRLQAVGHRPTILAGIVGAERQQTGIINLDDGLRAGSSSDRLSSLDPQLTSAYVKR
jgi:hypothetical protein